MITFKNILSEDVQPLSNNPIEQAVEHYLKDDNGDYSLSYQNRMKKCGQFFKDLCKKQNNRIEVYRVIFVENKKHIKLKNTGTSWTFNKKQIPYLAGILLFVQRHAYKKRDNELNAYVLHGYVSVDDVHWIHTIGRYFSLSESGNESNREDEITLKKGIVPKDIQIIPYDNI